MTRKLWLLCGGLAVAGVVTSHGGVVASTIAAQERAQEQRPPTLPVVPVLPQPTVRVEEPPLRPGARMKPLEPGRKIVDHFDAGAGDRDVVVERWENDSDGEGPPAGVSDVAWRTMFSPAVFVVRVNATQGYVTADGAWIESMVTGTVIRLLKNATPVEMQVDSTVSFVTSGGRIEVDGNILQAMNRTAFYRNKELRVGGDYLVFTVKRPEPVLYAHPEATYEIVGNRLRPLRNSRGGLHKRIADTEADAVMAEVMSSAGVEAPPRRLGEQR